MEEKIKALYSDKNFTDELSAAKSFEEAATLFASHGVVISAQDLENIAKEAMANGEAELSEEMLEQISGGGIGIAICCVLGGYVVGRLIEWLSR